MPDRAILPVLALLAAVSPAGAQARAEHPATVACAAGQWSVAAPDPADAANARLPVRYQTEHMALRWEGDLVDDADARAAGAHLEYVWGRFIGTLGFPEPDCGAATKTKVNIYIGADYGLAGGVDDLGRMGMWIGPGGLRDRFGLAHELAHALQGATGAYRDTPFGGWIWESHANFMALQLPEFRNIVHCSALQVNYPHLYYGTTRMRYCNIQFWEYLKNRFGYRVINDLWGRAPKRGDPAAATADPFAVLMRNQGWSIAQLNDVFADWAMHNANWDYVDPDGTDHGAVFRGNYGGYERQPDDRILRATILDPVDLDRRRFAVPFAWAPQRWGYNIVKLYPDKGAQRIDLRFRGVIQTGSATAGLPGLADEPDAIPAPDSGWRWGVVSVDAKGRSRYSAIGSGARGELSVDMRPGDQAHYLIVMGTPSQFHPIRWDQSYYTLYRYPWMVEFTGAMPEGHQPDMSSGVAGGHRHPNGGGWVGPDAQVDATAYVGPYARVVSGSVRGQARIEDHAVVLGGTVQDHAVAAGLSVIRGNTVLKDHARTDTSFMGIGEFEQNIVLSGNARLSGDVEQRGASFDRGVFYGFVDPATVTDRTHGAALTAPVPEVTARPDYRWIP